MNFRHLLCSAAIAACLVAPAAATATVQGTITDTNSFVGYMGVMTNISDLSGASTLPDTGFVFCIEGSLDWAGTGSTRQYTLADSFAPFLASPQTVGQTTAMLHYVIDTYYAAFMQGQYGQQSGYGFNQAVWQLTDFDGTQASLQVAPDDDNADARGDYALYATIMGDLHDHIAAIAPSYRSTRYDIRFLKESDPDLQSLALVTERANAVPEPSSLALMLAGGFGIVVAARRKQRA